MSDAKDGLLICYKVNVRFDWIPLEGFTFGPSFLVFRHIRNFDPANLKNLLSPSLTLAGSTRPVPQDEQALKQLGEFDIREIASLIWDDSDSAFRLLLVTDSGGIPILWRDGQYPEDWYRDNVQPPAAYCLSLGPNLNVSLVERLPASINRPTAQTLHQPRGQAASMLRVNEKLYATISPFFHYPEDEQENSQIPKDDMKLGGVCRLKDSNDPIDYSIPRSDRPDVKFTDRYKPSEKWYFATTNMPRTIKMNEQRKDCGEFRGGLGYYGGRAWLSDWQTIYTSPQYGGAMPSKLACLQNGSQVYALWPNPESNATFLSYMSADNFGKMSRSKVSSANWTFVLLRGMENATLLPVQGSDPNAAPRLYIFSLSVGGVSCYLRGCYMELHGTEGNYGDLKLTPGTTEWTPDNLYALKSSTADSIPADLDVAIEAVQIDKNVILSYTYNGSVWLATNTISENGWINLDANFTTPFQVSSEPYSRFLSLCTAPSRYLY